MSTPPITEFWNEYRFLSNFYPAELVWDNIIWTTAEHAYQAAKSTDRDEKIRMSRLSTPGQAKREGKKIAMRPDWDDVRYDIMNDIVRCKFAQNPALAAKLVDTGDARLEEGNTWNDRTWGVCPPGSGRGLNWLGEILMDLRSDLIARNNRA